MPFQPPIEEDAGGPWGGDVSTCAAGDRRAGSDASDVIIEWDLHDPGQDRAWETICTLANGYLGVRGVAEEAAELPGTYPGTYLAGGYNRSVTGAAEREFDLTQLVNWPNWLPLQVRPFDGDWLSADSAEVLAYRQRLNVSRGQLQRSVHLRDPQGRETSIESWRIVSMAQRHLACLHWMVRPHNWSGPVELRSAIEGSIENRGVPRYEPFENRQFELTALGHDSDSLWLESRSLQSLLYWAAACRTRAFVDGRREPQHRRCWKSESHVEERIRLECAPGAVVHIEKTIAIYSSRDRNTLRPLESARSTVRNAPAAPDLRHAHETAWKHIWQRCEIRTHCKEDLQRTISVNAFHLLQTLSPHVVHLDVGAPARGLHGEEYGGHIFWDQIFTTPFFNLRMPDVSRALLAYRHRRLDAAKQLASDAGFAGAMFPWRSAAEGTEETPPVQLNPRTGQWAVDYTYLQRHVGAAVAYNVWQEYESTHDPAFLESYGAELFLEVCRFWASAVERDASTGRYHIRGVVGPDEFHTCYPGSNTPGIDDNAYTNAMAAWCLRSASTVVDLISLQRRDELFESLGIDRRTLQDWRQVAACIHIPFHDGDIISQFRGYADLEELDWGAYRQKYGNIRRIDQILDAEGDTVWRYKVSRQPDVLMLFYLLPFEMLRTLFLDAGYALDRAMVKRNIDYYSCRTSHGSSLSDVVHAWIGLRWCGVDAWSRFIDTARLDFPAQNSGNQRTGIHLAAMGGTLDLVQRCLIGAEPDLEVLWLDPCAVPQEVEVSMPLLYRGLWLDIRRTATRLIIEARGEQRGCACVGFRGERVYLEPGRCVTFDLG